MENNKIDPAYRFDSIMIGITGKNFVLIDAGIDAIIKLGTPEIFDVKRELVLSNPFRHEYSIKEKYGILTLFEVAQIISEDPEKLGYSEEHKEYGKYLMKRIIEIKQT